MELTRIAVLFVMPGVLQCAPEGNDLFAALRNGDAAAARRFSKNVNAKDETGATPLMYAALYSDAETVRLLLNQGANPNAADNAGATALMWAIPDEEKVRLLLDHGARVNVVSKATGRTPLLIAAGRPGAVQVVRLLLEKGADPKARDRNEETALMRAVYSNEAEIFRLLLDRGVDVNAKSRSNYTALMEAVSLANSPAIIEMLLDRGADVNGRDEEGYTPLTSANFYGDVRPFLLLIAKGADPKARNIQGQDLLMSASASDMTTPGVIRELMKRGLDPKARVQNLHTRHGYGHAEAPLDWAARHGDTAVARLLAEVTGEPQRKAQASDAPRLQAKTARAAIEKALPPLYEGGREFFKRSGCTSCHHNLLPSVAFAMARSAGITLDEEKVRRNYLQSAAWVKGSQDGFLQDVRFPGGDTTAAYLMWGFEAGGHKRDRSTDAVVHHLAYSQVSDGGFRVRADRPPIESGRVTPTAVSIKALRAYTIPGRKADIDRRVQRAAKWLAEYRPRTGEERSMRVLGLAWAGGNADAVREAAGQLASTQRPDGGWAQLDSLSSDAYATGQALYALHLAGRLSKETLEKGVHFLLDTQLADGTWHVRSRAYPLQTKYFDTGFPHGRDQWISAAGTSWAVIGLSLAVR
ncbi:MAG: ankyrin repeat domain-containing protein [Bryobacterales bacterium]|nr:ankyrin repeat domain-containing protein [Bryobacterales bacterium]